jgi:hypothetical protein
MHRPGPELIRVHAAGRTAPAMFVSTTQTE